MKKRNIDWDKILLVATIIICIAAAVMWVGIMIIDWGVNGALLLVTVLVAIVLYMGTYNNTNNTITIIIEFEDEEA